MKFHGAWMLASMACSSSASTTGDGEAAPGPQSANSGDGHRPVGRTRVAQRSPGTLVYVRRTTNDTESSSRARRRGEERVITIHRRRQQRMGHRGLRHLPRPSSHRHRVALWPYVRRHRHGPRHARDLDVRRRWHRFQTPHAHRSEREQRAVELSNRRTSPDLDGRRRERALRLRHVLVREFVDRGRLCTVDRPE